MCILSNPFFKEVLIVHLIKKVFMQTPILFHSMLVVSFCQKRVHATPYFTSFHFMLFVASPLTLQRMWVLYEVKYGCYVKNFLDSVYHI